MKIQSTTEQICSYLKKQISEGNLQQGQQLNLNSIAEEMGVSVTPVRDAVNLLIYEGFIDKVGNKMFIHKIPEDERRMLDEALIAQICTGYELCIKMGLREKLLSELEACLKEQSLAELTDTTDRLHAKVPFDTLFVSCTGNKFLTRNIVKDFEYYDDLMYIAYQVHNEKQRLKSLEEHRQLIQLVREERDDEFHDFMVMHYRDLAIDQ